MQSFKKKCYIAIIWGGFGVVNSSVAGSVESSSVMANGSVVTSAVSESILTVLGDEWYPINGKPHSTEEGFGLDLMREIFEKKHQIKIDYQLTPWERSVQQVEKGAADCVVGAYHEDVPGFIFPKEPLIEDQLALFTLKEKEINYTGFESLLNLQVGLVSGYSYGERLDQFIEKNKQVKFLQYAVGDTPLQTNLKKLRAKRIDVLVENNVVMVATLKQQQMTDQMKLVSFLGDKIAIYVACSPKKESSKKYVMLWDEGVKALKESGTFSAILARYGLSSLENER